jgi:hypothetical protein
MTEPIRAHDADLQAQRTNGRLSEIEGPATCPGTPLHRDRDRGKSLAGFVQAALPLLSGTLLVGSAGCLPDPRPYDPCSDETSKFYSVAPKGCNGHTLEVLYADKRTGETFASLPDATASLGGRMSVPSALAMNETQVFWFDALGRGHATSKASPHEDTLLQLPSYSTGLIGIAPTGASLDIVTLEQDAEQSELKTRIFEIPLPQSADPGSLPEPLELRSTRITKIVRAEDQFVFLDASGVLRRAEFGSDESSAIASGYIYAFTVHNTRAYYLRRNDPGVYWVDLADGDEHVLVRDPWLKDHESDLVSAGDGTAFFTCDAGFDSCDWVIVRDDGVVQSIAKHLSYGIQDAVADVNTFALVGTLVENDFHGPAALHAWDRQSLTHTKLAAPLMMVTQLGLDAEYVYLNDIANDIFQLERGGSAMVSTERLIRVRRQR